MHDDVLFLSSPSAWQGYPQNLLRFPWTTVEGDAFATTSANGQTFMWLG